MTSHIKLLILSQNNSAPLVLNAGKSTVYKARAAERYRLGRPEDAEAPPLPHVVVRRVGDDLRFDYADNTQLILEGYFTVCKDSGCELTLDSAGGLVFTDAYAPLGVLRDGSTLLYVQGGQEALTAIASGNSSLRLALGEPAGHDERLVAQVKANAQDAWSELIPARLRQLLNWPAQGEASGEGNRALIGWLGMAGGLVCRAR